MVPLCVCVGGGGGGGGGVFGGFVCMYELRMASTDNILRFINTLITIITNYCFPPWEIWIFPRESQLRQGRATRIPFPTVNPNAFWAATKDYH